MPIYSTKEMKKLYSMIENTLNTQEKEILQLMMEKFNGIVKIAIRQHEYITAHENEYADNMKMNHKLIEKNKLLEEKIDRLLINKKYMQEELRQKNAILRKLNIKV